MKISVFGLGYVGVVSSACFANLGHDVIGVDVVEYKVDSINQGEAPLEEDKLEEIIFEQVKKGKLSATVDTRQAVLDTDISFVCVGTPPKENGDLDLTYLKRVCEEIGKALREKDYHIVVIRSTMFPGSLKILEQVLEKSSGKKCGKDFDIAVNPEFLREGSAIDDFYNAPYVVIGTDNKKICEKVFEAYKGVKSKKFLVKSNVAQMIKYASNSWHAVKVTFANEISSICKKAGINSKNLMKLFLEDNQLNISKYYMMPGFAYGGSCLTKDTAALKNKAREFNLNIPLINSISNSNMQHIRRAIELIESKNKNKIGILGLTFKAGTDDIRGNPILFVINYLLDKGYDIKIFDKLVDESDIEALNQSYRKEVFDLISREDLKEKVGSISTLFSDLNSVLEQDIIIISNRDESLKQELKNLSKEKIIIDLQNLFSQEDFEAEYEHL